MDEEGNTALTSHMWEVGGADMAQLALLPMYAVLFSRAVACLALYTPLNSFLKGTVGNDVPPVASTWPVVLACSGI